MTTGIIARIIANELFTLANKAAPIISASILSCYALGGRKITILTSRGELTERQKNALDRFQKL